MKQYLPMKPVKRGFKVWVRADAVNGFCCDFDVYVGKASDGVTREVGLGESVVLKLSEPLCGGNYQVYCDNFFSSISLFETLHERGIYACGTARRDRHGFPDTLKSVTLQRGEFISCQRGNLTATIWQDKRQVVMLSTMSDPAKEESVQRTQKDGNKVSVPCPDAVVVYNRYMGGVDLNDQLRHYYCVRTKCMKNYKYIFWFTFDICIINAHILRTYSPSCIPNSQLSLKSFRLQLADQLIGNYNSRKRVGRPQSSGPTHPPPPLPPPEQDGPSAHCKKFSVQGTPNTVCNACPNTDTPSGVLCTPYHLGVPSTLSVVCYTHLQSVCSAPPTNVCSEH